MRAAVLAGAGRPPVLRDLPVPEPGPGQALVRVEACGVCHTDAHVWQGDYLPASGRAPAVLGHEGVGRVAAVGAGVADLPEGSLVGIPWLHDTCGACRECLGGCESFCQRQRANGFDLDGAFAGYALADARFLARLPDGLDPVATAPLMCAGLTAYGGLRRARIGPSSLCVIFGCGGLGLYAVQLARRFGAAVAAVDVAAANLERAGRLGATTLIGAGEDVEDRLRALGGADACLNFAPTKATWPWMKAAIRPRGTIVAAALVPGDVTLSQEWLAGTGVRLTGTSVGTREEMRELVAIHARAPLDGSVTAIGLDALGDALAALHAGRVTGRLVVDLRPAA